MTRSIHVDQIGYLAGEQKTAVLTWDAKRFALINESGEAVFWGEVTGGAFDAPSGDHVYYADFSGVEKAGRYRVVADDQQSYSFEIGENIYEDVKYAMLKALYFQRCGCALDEKHAGAYKHGVCHSEDAQLLEDRSVHIDVSGGWHDAGDYGRYITPAATTIGHLLYAWELFGGALSGDMNIPETGSGVPDLLSECRWELEWMLKMQDAKTGGVYHKLTSWRHAYFVMPENDKKQMLVFPMSTIATGAFAAAMALSYRAYKTYDDAFAGKMLDAARKAYDWLDQHTDFIGFENPDGCNTGGYGDRSDRDERFWAAAELYRATGEQRYHDDVLALHQEDFDKTQFGWSDVGGFGALCYVLTDCAVDGPVQSSLKKQLLDAADFALELSDRCKYGVAMADDEYVWGSNLVALNRGILLALGHVFTGNKQYKNAATDQLHYLFGRNAVGYSFVTGFGENAYKNPHSRPTVADGIDDPMPGWVSGGPNSHPSDEKAEWLIEDTVPPMKCYLDIWECYSLNEITIYWNSPAIFIAAML